MYSVKCIDTPASHNKLHCFVAPWPLTQRRFVYTEVTRGEFQVGDTLGIVHCPLSLGLVRPHLLAVRSLAPG